MPDKFALDDKFAQFSEHWRPKVVASLNGQELKLVKVQGEFPWHHHEHEDELFLVWRGAIRIEFRDRVVELGPGEALVVPRGVDHRPVAEQEAEILLFEPAGVLNTGNIIDETFTAPMGATV
nr:cupin domain-containing protein [Rhodoligotrophos defluvii]